MKEVGTSSAQAHIPWNSRWTAIIRIRRGAAIEASSHRRRKQDLVRLARPDDRLLVTWQDQDRQVVAEIDNRLAAIEALS